MRGPPLAPLLPLLLILNTTPANPESTSSPKTVDGEAISSLSSLDPSSAEYYSIPLGRSSVYSQWKVANENISELSKSRELPARTHHPRRTLSSMSSRRTTMIYNPVNTYQNANANTNSSVVNCTKCTYNVSENELFRQIRSKNSEGASTAAFVQPKTVFDYNKSGLKILSQMFESSYNVTNNPLEADNLVLSRNDSQISSIGSVDIAVPSDSKALDPRWNASLFLFNNSASRNRSSSVQRLGRTDSPMLNYIFDTYSTLNKHHHRNDRFGGPKIESSGGSLSVDTDAEATFDCRVSSLQGKLVSWVRRRPDNDKLEILTIGQQTYTADSRFSVDFRQPDNWRLVLQSAKAPDSGIYECQISTHPPLISRMELTVNAPVVSIVEAGGRELRDKYYERNSTLKLACRIRHLAAQTPAVFWLHTDRILNDDTLRGGVSVKTEAVDGGADSTLLVARLNSSDSGRYTCSVGTDLFAVVNVHVLNESLAELHQGAGSRFQSQLTSFLLPAAVLVIFFADHIVNMTLRYIILGVEIANPKSQPHSITSH